MNMKPFATKTNLRLQQRVEVSSRIIIEKTDGHCLTCKISNLSRSGVMVDCGLDTVQQLLPGMHPPAPGSWIEVKTSFTVPVVPAQPVTVTAYGKIVHMRRMARNEFQVGIHFSEFEGNGFDYIDTYVARLLADFRQLQQ